MAVFAHGCSRSWLFSLTNSQSSERSRFSVPGQNHFIDGIENVPGVGLEPTQPCGQGILNPSRLPIPPSGHDGAHAGSILAFARLGRGQLYIPELKSYCAPKMVRARAILSTPSMYAATRRSTAFSGYRHASGQSPLLILPEIRRVPVHAASSVLDDSATTRNTSR